MAITAAQVKELRERTGAGMMECKNALVETDGDFEKAIELMRKKGQAKADKKSDRVAAEGVIVAASNDEFAVLVEINTETDFTAKNEDFKNFSQAVAKTALQAHTDDLDNFLQTTFVDSNETVEQVRQNIVAKIGENIQVRRVAVVNIADHAGTYLHGSRIGVLVNVKGGSAELAKDIAMHIAASSPITVKKEQVAAELVNKEKEIFKAQAEQTGKPAEIIEKMIQGRINKYLDEISLEGQPFVKDPNTKVGKLLQDQKAEVTQFIRFEVGEGIEKKADDFVAEVMATVQGV